MKSGWRWLAAWIALSSGALMAQQGGTINTLSVNPRQNQELTNSTGTETGQPSDSVPGSANQANGLVPSTTGVTTFGGSGDRQPAPTAKPAASNTAAQRRTAQKPKAVAQHHPAERNERTEARLHK
jgi:hypothetical protein